MELNTSVRSFFYSLMCIWRNLKSSNLLSERKGLVRERKNGQRETLADANGVQPPLLSPALRDKDCRSTRPGGWVCPNKQSQIRWYLLLFATTLNLVCFFVTNQDSPIQSGQVTNHEEENHIHWPQGKAWRKGVLHIRYMIPLHIYRKSNSGAQKCSACVC